MLLNEGRDDFTASNLGTAPARTYSAALADFNGDGHRGQQPCSRSQLVYLNDGKGHFTEGGAFGSPKWTTRYVTFMDLNGDSYPDLLAANRGDCPDPVNGKPGKGR